MQTFILMTCTICKDRRRSRIESMLASGESIRGTARHFKVSDDALLRHTKNCIRSALQQHQADLAEQTAITILGEMDWLRQETRVIYEEIRKGEPDYRAAVQTLSELRQQTKLRAELTGELDQRPQINIMQMPEWQEAMRFILTVLQPYPEAHRALITSLEDYRAKRRA